MAGRRQLVALLRIVAEPPDRVLYGDIVDPDTGDKAGFAGPDGVPAALTTWVSRVLGRPFDDTTETTTGPEK